MPPQESDRGFKCSYLVIRLAVFLEWLRLTVWSYVETVRKALGIDTTSNRAINPNNNSRKNDSYLAEKRKLIERCLCLQPKNPENVMPLEIITGKETTNKERKLSSSIDLWELRELALSDGGLLSGARSCDQQFVMLYSIRLCVNSQQCLISTRISFVHSSLLVCGCL